MLDVRMLVSSSSSIDIPEFPIDIHVVLELLVASDFLDC